MTTRALDIGAAGTLMKPQRSEVNRGTIDPDHTPGVPGDVDEMWAGWAWSVGVLRGLRPA